ncbi:unnamed protein product [Acanthoscelides obtectus]|uniref:Uncharacterized protein n=1 Tax=Acanthoscelides obtectus TaxID=200917 RepID=A0A9P0VTM4_ACAOB|nr:unnamed protein product [Acanthoscelides obtectus]CAK1656457.1 hypothetical protein AOBTE_LOCUS19719 [Acanthoscelides obtectus]
MPKRFLFLSLGKGAAVMAGSNFDEWDYEIENNKDDHVPEIVEQEQGDIRRLGEEKRLDPNNKSL